MAQSTNSSPTSPYAVDLGSATSIQQFAVPMLGGPSAWMYATVDYTDTTDINLFVLPAGAVIFQWLVNVKTAFNDSGTDLLNIDGAATATYALNLDVGVIGQITAGFVPSKLFDTPLGTDTQITAKYTGQNANANAGSAVVAVQYGLMGTS